MRSFSAFSAAVSDLKTDRIPNSGIASGACLAGFFALLDGAAFWNRLLAAAFVLAVLFPLFTLRKIGAGDVKLLMVLGLCMGYPAIGACLVRTFLAAGAVSLLLLADFRDRRMRLHMSVPVLLAVLPWSSGLC